METPNTLAGRTTEKIMLNIRRRWPELIHDVPLHNRIYSAVLDTLEGEMSAEISPASKLALDKAIVNYRSRMIPGAAR